MARIYNFTAGPATLPTEVLEEARDQLLDFKGIGMSLIESSHRAKAYDAVHTEAEANYRKLLNCPDDYAILFLSGGASMQFAMLPMYLLPSDGVADYVNSGSWAAKAIKEAKLIGKVNVAADTSKNQPGIMPTAESLNLTDGAAYVHITSNETIAGTQWKEFPRVKAPLVADMSSDILSRPLEIGRFAAIYAGAQKNIGPSGIALVVIRKDMAGRTPATLPMFLRYQTHIENNSLYNTPPTFSIYLMMLVSRWLLKTGLETVHKRNKEKAAKIYAVIDSSDFYRGTAAKEFRSDMNITFRLPDEKLEEAFAREAAAQGMAGLKGHRSVGGIRASVYNAMPMEGALALADFMREFERKKG